MSKMNMIMLTFKFRKHGFEVLKCAFKAYFKSPILEGKDIAPIFCYKDQMAMHHEDTVSTVSNIFLCNNLCFWAISFLS